MQCATSNESKCVSLSNNLRYSITSPLTRNEPCQSKQSEKEVDDETAKRDQCFSKIVTQGANNMQYCRKLYCQHHTSADDQVDWDEMFVRTVVFVYCTCNTTLKLHELDLHRIRNQTANFAVQRIYKGRVRLCKNQS
jgi:hypothetical protein